MFNPHLSVCQLDYLIVGEDAGDSKLSKARELDVKQINEDQFLQLICDKSGIKKEAVKYEEDEESEFRFMC